MLANERFRIDIRDAKTRVVHVYRTVDVAPHEMLRNGNVAAPPERRCGVLLEGSRYRIRVYVPWFSLTPTNG
jgi:hypothetical protein